MSRAISQLADGPLLVAIIVAVVIALVGAAAGARRFGVSRSRLLPVLLVTMPIFAVTLFDRPGTLRDASVADGLTWWTRGWDEVPDLARGDAGWKLNVILFVPAGAAWTWLVRRPGLVVAAAAVGSFLIETVQAVTYLGAPDPGDLVANASGAAIGAAPVAVWLRRRHPGETRPADRRVVAASIIGLALVVAIGVGFVQSRANVARNELRAELESALAGITIADVDAMFVAYESGGSNPFESLVSVRPDWWVHVGDGVPLTARYPIEFFGAHRCVFVTFSDGPPEFRNEKGSVCTRFLGSGPVPD